MRAAARPSSESRDASAALRKRAERAARSSRRSPERQDVILGGGLAGLTAAYTLQGAGEDHWQLYEKEGRVGGHARSVTRDGYVFDLGPHILFTSDREIELLIRDLLGENFVSQERQAYIYHHEHRLYTRFPFQAHLYGLPTGIVTECLVGLVDAVERRARGAFRPRNYEEWLRGTFGDAIAERLMIPYARKVWTVEPETMDFSWIARRVPTPDVERIIRGALTDDVSQVGATAQFWYPREGGIEALPRALGERVRGVNLRRRVERIELPAKAVVFDDGEVVPFDRLIFSLPLCDLPRLVPGLPPAVERASRALRYQGIYCVSLGIDGNRDPGMHWAYFYEDGFPFHRISFPEKFSPANVPAGKRSISTEVAFSAARPLDRDGAVKQTLEALGRAGLVSPDEAVELVHVEEISPAYVVYDLDHARHVAVIRAWLATHDISLAGRFGQWQYFNMDHAMRGGWAAAEAILRSRGEHGSRRGRVPAGSAR